MKVLTKITDTISKVAEWIIMAMILGLVGLIVTELCRRNFLNQSWLPTTELCGILFSWTGIYRHHPPVQQVRSDPAGLSLSPACMVLLPRSCGTSPIW